MELATNYMGLELRNPLVGSPSPLSHTVDGVRRLADAGVGAIVLHSLFEEQLHEQAALNDRLIDAGTESFAESLSYFPSAVEDEPGPRQHLSLLERAAAAVDVPVIASVNAVTPGAWTEYAHAMQDAGAAAIELNIYYVRGDPSTPGRDVERLTQTIEIPDFTGDALGPLREIVAHRVGDTDGVNEHLGAPLDESAFVRLEPSMTIASAASGTSCGCWMSPSRTPPTRIRFRGANPHSHPPNRPSTG